MDVIEKLRQLGSIETSQLYSQRKTLNEAADEIERLRGELNKWRELAEKAHDQELRIATIDGEAAALRTVIKQAYSVLHMYLPEDPACDKILKALASGAGEKAAAVLSKAAQFYEKDDHNSRVQLRAAVAAWKGH